MRGNFGRSAFVIVSAWSSLRGLGGRQEICGDSLKFGGTLPIPDRRDPATVTRGKGEPVRISNEQIQQILQTQGVKPKNGPAAPSRVEGAQAADAAQFSLTGQEVTKALGVIAKQPALRADKVSEIKAQIAAGTYQVSGQDIARAILSRNLADDLQ